MTRNLVGHSYGLIRSAIRSGIQFVATERDGSDSQLLRFYAERPTPSSQITDVKILEARRRKNMKTYTLAISTSGERAFVVDSR